MNFWALTTKAQTQLPTGSGENILPIIHAVFLEKFSDKNKMEGGMIKQ